MPGIPKGWQGEQAAQDERIQKNEEKRMKSDRIYGTDNVALIKKFN